MRCPPHAAWLAFIVGTTAACAFDRGGVSGDDVTDVDGSTIDAAPIDASPIDGPPGTIDAPPSPDATPDLDTDDDGFLDAVDNCPAIPNLDQHDEDGDAVGDVCDNCPHVPNPLQENTTESSPDGVGDACDPDSTGANVIAYFNGFGGAGVPDGWTVVGGTWTQAGDELSQSATTQANHLVYLAGASFTDLVVQTVIDVDVVPPAGSGSTLRSVSVVERYAPGTQLGTGYLCSFFDDVSNSSPGFQLASRFANDGSTPDGVIEAMSVELAGATVRYDVRAIGTAITCTATTGDTVQTPITNAMHASGTIALRTNTVAASYRYVVVITPAP